jgi:hypothetical protein
VNVRLGGVWGDKGSWVRQMGPEALGFSVFGKDPELGEGTRGVCVVPPEVPGHVEIWADPHMAVEPPVRMAIWVEAHIVGVRVHAASMAFGVVAHMVDVLACHFLVQARMPHLRIRLRDVLLGVRQPYTGRLLVWGLVCFQSVGFRCVLRCGSPIGFRLSDLA